MRPGIIYSVLFIVVLGFSIQTSDAQTFKSVKEFVSLYDTNMTVFIPGMKGDRITRDAFLSSDSLQLMNRNKAVVKTAKITSFSFIFTSGGDIYQKKITGNKLTQEIKKLVTSAKSSEQKIFIEDIEVNNIQGNEYWKLFGSSLVIE